MTEPDYCYFVYNKKRSKRVVITPTQVTVEYPNGGIMDTNICPAGLFPGQRTLTRKQKMHIARNAVEGVYYSPSELKEIYRQMLEE